MFARCVLVLVAVFVGLDGLVLALGSVWFGDSLSTAHMAASLFVGTSFLLLALLVPQSQRGIASGHALGRAGGIGVSALLVALTPVIVQSNTLTSICNGEVTVHGHPWLDTAGAIVLLGWLFISPRDEPRKVPAESCGAWAEKRVVSA